MGHSARLLNSVAFFAVFLVLSIRFRVGFLKNMFHRTGLVYGLAFSGSSLDCGYWTQDRSDGSAAYDAGSHRTGVATSLYASCFHVGALAHRSHRTFAALASASYPDYSQVITSIVIPVATIINLVVWIRTTMKRASRRKHSIIRHTTVGFTTYVPLLSLCVPADDA